MEHVERQSFMHIPFDVVECIDAAVDGVCPFGPEFLEIGTFSLFEVVGPCRS